LAAERAIDALVRSRADHALSEAARAQPGRPDRAAADERVNRAFGGQYSDRPGYPGRGPVYDGDGHRTADDRAVEAMLASVREPCTAQQLARGLGWTLTRTVDALQRLEESLADTGQILTRLGHHNYTLRPRLGLVTDREIARCLRHNRDPLDVTAAWVLYRALTRPSRERAREALRNPAEHAAVQRLIAAGLLEDDDGVLRPTPRAEATFQAPPERRWLR
jgi:chromosome segregation and condensation protein ScpB